MRMENNLENSRSPWCNQATSLLYFIDVVGYWTSLFYFLKGLLKSIKCIRIFMDGYLVFYLSKYYFLSTWITISAKTRLLHFRLTRQLLFYYGFFMDNKTNWHHRSSNFYFTFTKKLLNLNEHAFFNKQTSTSLCFSNQVHEQKLLK